MKVDDIEKLLELNNRDTTASEVNEDKIETQLHVTKNGNKVIHEDYHEDSHEDSLEVNQRKILEENQMKSLDENLKEEFDFD